MTPPPQGQPEDRRAAATLATSVSGYVMTAALGIIGAQAAIVTFTLDKKEHLVWFFWVWGAGFVLLVASIFCGGKGMTEIYKQGYTGNWQTQTSGRFQLQATLTLAAIPLTLGSLFLGDPKREPVRNVVATPPALSASDALLRVERLPLDVVFVTGEPCAAESGALEVEVSRAAQSIQALAASGPVAYVLVIGSADARELRPSARSRPGSNLGLAQLRSECVSEALRRQLASASPAVSLPAIIPLVRGPRHPGPEEWPHDRAVQIWAAALQPRPSRPASTPN